MDDLRTLWAAHTTLLERSLRLDERALRLAMVDRTSRTMTFYSVWTWVQLAAAALALLANGAFLAAHAGDLPYLLSAIAVQAYLALHAGSAAYRLVLSARLDHTAPVAAMQRTIGRLQMVEFRTFTWALLFGVVIWVQMLAVVVRGLGGFDLYASVPTAWIVANIVFGVLVAAAGLWLARRFVERPDLGPWARRLVDHLSGRSLRRAARFLGELREFERDER